MPRPIEFDRDQALHQAMLLFWRQGYNATSINQLTASTDLRPGSLYAAFHSKRELFVEALEHYFTEVEAFVDAVLDDGQPPLARIRGFFEQLLSQCTLDAEAKGCLLVNTLLELPADDAEINARIGRMFGFVEDRFCEVLEQARARGELDSQKDPRALARMLVAGIYGLRVYSKAQPDDEALRSIVENLLGALH